MSRNISHTILAIFFGLLMAPLQAEDNKVAATVNGFDISDEMVSTYMQQKNARMPQGMPAQDRKTTIEELINVFLLEQEAIKQGLDKDPNIINQMEWQKRSVLINAVMLNFVGKNPISDDELKKSYDAQVAKMGGKEYKARHILLKTEDEAKALIKQLDDGANFAELAKEHSTGPTGKQGGDLGWFSPTQMAKPFSDAVKQLKQGSYTKKPVQTQFGWHVILTEDSRDGTAPPFDQLKPQLMARKQGQLVEQYMQELRAGAKIELK